jgi:peptide methionine sulfoxide reductase msrA/msrB
MRIFIIIGLLLGIIFLLEGVGEAMRTEKAIFAGGCFWCMESAFQEMPGVIAVTSGYTGGKIPSPTYEQVSSGKTGHYEAVLIEYDPDKISYATLLETFWTQIDPTDAGGQFADRGTQYHMAIFYTSEEQKALAEQSKQALNASGKFSRPIITPILPAQSFYNAEEYHQDYYKKNSADYRRYRKGSGREDFIKKTWGSETPLCPIPRLKRAAPSENDLKKKLTPRQFHVTQQEGTEPPFQNEYWDNKKDGIYVDLVSGEALFSSTDKFDSGTGWPSFTKPIEAKNIVEKKDKILFTERTEVRSTKAGSHLGHVFTDGPKPTGMRFCINSAALRFVPKEDLGKEGYGQYKTLFR